MIRATRPRTRSVAALATVGILATACSGGTSPKPLASGGGSGRVAAGRPLYDSGPFAVDHAAVPVKVSPTLAGKWHWVGTRTLRFEYAGSVDRLPMATTYTAEVPAGTKSQLGHRLAHSVHWSFRTPPPTVVEFAPEHAVV